MLQQFTTLFDSLLDWFAKTQPNAGLHHASRIVKYGLEYNYSKYIACCSGSELPSSNKPQRYSEEYPLFDTKADPSVFIDGKKKVVDLDQQQVSAMRARNSFLFTTDEGDIVVINRIAGNNYFQTCILTTKGTGIRKGQCAIWQIPDNVMSMKDVTYAIHKENFSSGIDYLYIVAKASDTDKMVIPCMRISFIANLTICTPLYTLKPTGFDRSTGSYKKVTKENKMASDKDLDYYSSMLETGPEKKKTERAVFTCGTGTAAVRQVKAIPTVTSTEPVKEAPVKEALVTDEADNSSPPFDTTDTDADETKDDKPAKKSRVRRTIDPSLTVEWDKVITYLLQPVADSMSVEDITAEAANIRELIKAGATRSANLMRVMERAVAAANKAVAASKTAPKQQGPDAAKIKEALESIAKTLCV